MKLLFDFFPIVIFFLTYKFYGDMPKEWIDAVNQLPLVNLTPGKPEHAILMATLVIIVATIIQTIVHFALHKKVEKMHIISLVLLIGFGGLTLAFNDENFIKWKVTIVNWIFAAAFLLSEYVGERKTLVERMMSQALTVPKAIWLNTNRLWIVFFFSVGVVNLFVAYNFSSETWVNFKLFGMLGLTFAFVIVQGIYLQKHMIEEPESTKDTD